MYRAELQSINNISIISSYTSIQEVLLDILAVPLAVVDERTKSRIAVAGPGAIRTAQISTCPMSSLVVYTLDLYPT